MILDTIIGAFTLLIEGIINLLPFNLPPMPTAISGGFDFILDRLGTVVSFISYVYSPPFLSALVLISIGILTFDYVYGLVMWTLGKIPFIDIH